MKVVIDWDEWYPVYLMDAGPRGVEVDVDQSTIKRWSRIARQFGAMQDEMRKLVKDQVKKESKSKRM